MTAPTSSLAKRIASFGMLGILGALCALFSLLTIDQQQPNGADAASQIQRSLTAEVLRPSDGAIVVTGTTESEQQFASSMKNFFDRKEILPPVFNLNIISGSPQDARALLEKLNSEESLTFELILSPDTAQWKLFENLDTKFRELKLQIHTAQPYRWPNFLKRDNLINVANQIVVIAIIAIGMTMVIISGGIDLSVGSLIALSAVVSTRLIRDFAGGTEANILGMIVCCLAAILACTLVGLASGWLTVWSDMPPFIATLGTMLIASGLAYILSNGQSIADVPNEFVWLGRGSLAGFPNAICLMLLLYAVSHFVMSRMTLGRYIYAIGGNREAARLCGIPVRRILVITYLVSGAMAGLGGIIMASQLKSGAATYGNMYELYVIAAVVVGGTSLRGGEGSVFGTLVGAFIIAVIQNGMNLTGIESYTQKVVFGVVILCAVLIDQTTNKGRRRKS